MSSTTSSLLSEQLEVQGVTVSANQLKNIWCISKKIVNSTQMILSGNGQSHYYKLSIMCPLSASRVPKVIGYSSSVLAFGPSWSRGCINIKKLESVLQ